jgi:predicted secreted protein
VECGVYGSDESVPENAGWRCAAGDRWDAIPLYGSTNEAQEFDRMSVGHSVGAMTGSGVWALVAALLLSSACVPPLTAVTEVSTPPKLGLKAPAQIENGNSVPFEITASRPLGQGDELTLLVNETLAYVVRPTGKVTLRAFTGRVRMARSGVLRALVKTHGAGQVEASAPVTVSVGATIPDSGLTGNSNKTRVEGDELVVLFMNDMPKKGYVESASLLLADGGIEVTTTPLLSEKPQLGFRTGNSLVQVEVNAVATPSQ